MEWTRYTVYTTNDGIESVLGLLLNFGIDSTQVSDKSEFDTFLDENRDAWDYVDEDLSAEMSKETHIDFYLQENERELVAEISNALKQLKSSDKDGIFGRLLISSEAVLNEDWQNSWKKYFHTFEIGNRLTIKPYWEETDSKDKVVFEINPGLSFGTGTHHTTKMCLEDILETVKGGESVLDLGAGSGILSIVSMLFGADNAVAVDIDENSEKTIHENLKRNGLENKNYTVLIGNVLENEYIKAEILNRKYDIILANIVADVIIAILPFVKKALKSEGVFITSGIIDNRYDEVKEQILREGFKIISEKRSADWAEFKCSL